MNARLAALMLATGLVFRIHMIFKEFLNRTEVASIQVGRLRRIVRAGIITGSTFMPASGAPPKKPETGGIPQHTTGEKAAEDGRHPELAKSTNHRKEEIDRVQKRLDDLKAKPSKYKFPKITRDIEVLEDYKKYLMGLGAKEEKHFNEKLENLKKLRASPRGAMSRRDRLNRLDILRSVHLGALTDEEVNEMRMVYGLPPD